MLEKYSVASLYDRSGQDIPLQFEDNYYNIYYYCNITATPEREAAFLRLLRSGKTELENKMAKTESNESADPQKNHDILREKFFTSSTGDLYNKFSSHSLTTSQGSVPNTNSADQEEIDELEQDDFTQLSSEDEKTQEQISTNNNIKSKTSADGMFGKKDRTPISPVHNTLATTSSPGPNF